MKTLTGSLRSRLLLGGVIVLTGSLMATIDLAEGSENSPVDNAGTTVGVEMVQAKLGGTVLRSDGSFCACLDKSGVNGNAQGVIYQPGPNGLIMTWKADLRGNCGEVWAVKSGDVYFSMVRGPLYRLRSDGMLSAVLNLPGEVSEVTREIQKIEYFGNYQFIYSYRPLDVAANETTGAFDWNRLRIDRWPVYGFHGETDDGILVRNRLTNEEYLITAGGAQKPRAVSALTKTLGGTDISMDSVTALCSRNDARLLATTDQLLISLAASGMEEWRTPLPINGQRADGGAPWLLGTGPDDQVFLLGYKDILVIDRQGHVIWHDSATGATPDHPAFMGVDDRIGESACSWPLACETASRTLVVAQPHGENQLEGYDYQTGARLWRVDNEVSGLLHDLHYRAPGEVIAVSEAGVRAIEVATGRIRWRYPVDRESDDAQHFSQAVSMTSTLMENGDLLVAVSWTEIISSFSSESHIGRTLALALSPQGRLLWEQEFSGIVATTIWTNGVDLAEFVTATMENLLYLNTIRWSSTVAQEPTGGFAGTKTRN